MRNIAESKSSLCPPGDALGHLHRYLAENRGIVKLELPLKAFGLPTGLGLGLEVVLKYDALDAAGTAPIPVSWSAHKGGPYPTFSGMLRVEPEGDVRCRLAIDGSYDAPLGPVGAAFDMVAGQRIAVASLDALLTTLCVEIEKRALGRGVEAAYPR
jgi:hypothetical protein